MVKYIIRFFFLIFIISPAFLFSQDLDLKDHFLDRTKGTDRSPKDITFDENNGLLSFENFKFKLVRSKDDFQEEFSKTNGKIQEKIGSVLEVSDSPTKRYGVVVTGYGVTYMPGKFDVWLLDYQSKNEFSLNCAGVAPTAFWYGNKYLELFSNDNGTITNGIVDLANPKRNFECDNLIYFDPQNELLVWGEGNLGQDGVIIIQQGLDGSKQKKIEISLQPKNADDLTGNESPFAADSIKKDGNVLFIKFSYLDKPFKFDFCNF